MKGRPRAQEQEEKKEKGANLGEAMFDVFEMNVILFLQSDQY
jgi:hypothetical protein